jgi:TonB-linked SusC/RagA family outer membrane protein
MKKSILSLLLACFLQINLAFAQNVMKGVVSDANGPLVGVVIHDKDNAKGTTSDMSGKYALNGAESGHTIEFRYLGYVTETVVWDGKSVVNIKLKEDAVQLEETVVIGYGSVKKKDLTGAVGVINSSLIEKQSTSQLSQSLQGLIPGLTVTRSSSMPGASATVQVRGVTTMSDSSPLILVDGMMVSSLDNIASEDVQQITVLKDAASASIYGARAAAGVILITTKEATEGQLSIGYNGEISLSSPTEFPKFLTDPYHYMTMYNEWSWNDAGNPAGGEFANYSQDYIDNYATNNRYDPIQYPIYDWKDAILSNTAMRHKHNLTMTYGNKVIKSHTSATYENADAIYKGSNHERISIRSRNNLKISDKLSGSIDFSVRYATKNDPTSGSPIRAAYMYPSIYLGLYPDGRVGPGKDGSLSNTLAALLEGGEKKTVSNTMTGKFSLSYKPIKDLTLTANLTPTVGTVSIKEMKKAIPVYDAYETDVMLGYVSGYTSNSLSEERRNIKSLEKQFIATYDKTFSKVHNFNAMVGYEDYSYTYETMSGSTNDMSLSSFPYLDLANKNALAVAGNSYQNAYRSFFGRVMYNYDSRYYLQLNAREDGSSRFHKDHRWGFFPAGALAWRISNEDFLKDNQVVSNLKLRVSYGTSGNDRIDADLYQKLYGVSSSRPAGWGENSHYYYNFYNSKYVYNPDVRWETTITRNIGFDFGFFKERISGTVDVYWNTVKDLLVPSDIPGYTGYTKLMTNVGQTSNRGIELQLNAWLVETKDFSLNATFNIGHNKNKIDKLASGEKEWILTSGWRNDVVNSDDYRAYVGGTSGLIYGYVNDGFYTVADFESFDSKSRTWKLKEGVVDSSPLSDTPRPGNAKFKKLTPVDPNSTNPYQLTEADRTVIGNTTPKFSGGFGLNATYKGFDMSMFFNFMYDFDVLNANKIMLTTWADNKENNFLMDIASDKRWRNFDDMGNEIRYSPEVLAEFNKNATMWNPTSIGRPICMSYAVEDGSFLRLNSATLGYTLPSVWTKKVGLSKVRFYVSGNNLFTLTGYSGYDPEVNIATGLTPNIDYDRYPRSRTYTFGAQLTF